MNIFGTAIMDVNLKQLKICPSWKSISLQTLLKNTIEKQYLKCLSNKHLLELATAIVILVQNQAWYQDHFGCFFSFYQDTISYN